MAVANYYDVNGQYPPAYITDESGKPIHSWRILILPYIGEESLYHKYDFTQPWNSAKNRQLAREMPALYAFHGEYKEGVVTTNYLAVVGENTVWPGAVARTGDGITDKLSSTILIVENDGAGVHWMEPRDLDIDSMRFEINHPQGVSSKYHAPAVAMVDGSLRRLESQLPQNVLMALLTANGGEPIESWGDTWRLLPDGRSRKQRRTESRH